MKKAWPFLLAIVLIILISYFRFWWILLSIVFFGLALFEFISEYRGLSKLKRLDNFVENEYSTLVHLSIPLNVKRNFFQNIRHHIFLFFNCVNNALCWPVLLYWGMHNGKLGLRTRAESVASIRIKPIQNYFTYYYLIFSIVLGTLFYFGILGERYASLYATTLWVGIDCLLLTFLLSDENLASIFKNSPDNIFKSLILTCFKITLTTVILFILILAVWYRSPINRNIVDIMINDFFKQESIGLLWKGKFKDIGAIHLAISLSGLLFAATIIDTLKNFKSFKRGSSNFQTIATSYLHRKQYNAGLEWLQKMPRQSWDRNMWNTYMVFLVGLNQVDKAIDCFPRIHFDTEETDYGEDYKFSDLIYLCKSYVIDPMLVNSIYSAWIPVCKCDGILLTNIFQSMMITDTMQYAVGLVNDFNKDDNAKERLFLSNHLAILDSEKRSQKDFINILKEGITRKDMDSLSRALAHFYLITFAEDYEFEPENDFKRLTDFEDSTDTLVKPKDLAFIALSMVGTLKSFKAKPSFYESIVFVYNNIKNRITNPEYLETVNKVDYMLQK